MSLTRRAIRPRCASVIEPGDVLLVEGDNRISAIIKYLTQSTWSHSALLSARSTARTSPTASRMC